MPVHFREPPYESRSLADAKTAFIQGNAETCARLLFLREVQLDLIAVTPAPIFTGLERLHDGVLVTMKVFVRVFVFR